MTDKKISPSSGVGSSEASPFTHVGGTPTAGLNEVFLKMAHNTPEEAAASLRSATMGSLTTSEWELDEEEVVQLWLVEEVGQICGGPVGSMTEGRFCIEKVLGDSGTCGKFKVHLARKRKGLEPSWYIGAGERGHSGAYVTPRLDVEKIPEEAWGMLLDPEGPMKAPKSILACFLQDGGKQPGLSGSDGFYAGQEGQGRDGGASQV
jgi:hypothetical protein